MDDRRLTLAFERYSAGKMAEAFAMFQVLAEEGDTDAMLQVAFMFTRGEGVPFDLDEARKWEERALGLGNRTARLNLAATHRMLGNLEESRRLYEEAIADGDGEAAVELAKLLMVSQLELPNVHRLLMTAKRLGRLSEESATYVDDTLRDLPDR